MHVVSCVIVTLIAIYAIITIGGARISRCSRKGRGRLVYAKTKGELVRYLDRTSKPTLVCIVSRKCPACRVFQATISKLKTSHHRYDIIVVDGLDVPYAPRRFNVTAFPTVLKVCSGRVLGTRVGIQSPGMISDFMA